MLVGPSQYNISRNESLTGKDSCFSHLPRNKTYESFSIPDLLIHQLTAKYMNILETDDHDYSEVNTMIFYIYAGVNIATFKIKSCPVYLDNFTDALKEIIKISKLYIMLHHIN